MGESKNRSSSSANRAASCTDRFQVGWAVWAIFNTRPGQCSASPRVMRASTASCTSGSETDSTGSRLLDWLQAFTSVFMERGYTSGVLSCFSSRQPRTRHSRGARSSSGMGHYPPGAIHQGASTNGPSGVPWVAKQGALIPGGRADEGNNPLMPWAAPSEPVPKPPCAALGAPGGVPPERRDEHSGST